MYRLKKRKKKNCASSKKLLASIKEKGPLGKESPFHQKRRKQSVRIRRVAGRQASRPLLIGLKVRRMLKITRLGSTKVRRMLKRTSSLDELMSIVHRMSMKLESKFFSLFVETLQRNQSVRNVNNTPYT